jgi:Fe2+ or Zn2+ uptake regulation protein
MLARTTHYVEEVLEHMQHFGHATNAQLLARMQKRTPTLSATTVHRITVRLHERGTLAEAPADAQGAMRYDANLTPHDHFICTDCGGIRDLDVATSLIPQISEALGGCTIKGRLVIYGNCESCTIKEGII